MNRIVALLGIGELFRSRSCEGCCFRDGRWCGERALVEMVLKAPLPPEASPVGRVPLSRAWQSCQGLLFRGRFQ